MKIVRITLLYVCCVLNTEMTYSQDVDRISDADRTAIGELGDAIIEQMNGEKPDFQRIAADIQKMEKLTAAEPVLYARQMRYIVCYLQNKGDEAAELAKNLIEKMVFSPIDKSKLSTSEILEIQDYQIQTLLPPQYSCKTDILNDCDPDLRRKYSKCLLDLYQNAVQQIDDHYDFNARENQMVLNGFKPPASYQGLYISGMDMSDAEDEETREAYKKYLEEQRQKVNKRAEQTKARDIQKHSRESIQTDLIAAYSLFPYRTAELEKILTDTKVDVEMAKTILDAVRKVEKEHPDKGFRIWLSKDKLLKTEAKFVSYDTKVKEATLEREDGKQMSIEWSALRKEDQDYIRRQVEAAPKKLKD